MERLARSLNRTGIERLRAFLAELRAGRAAAWPVELVDDPAFSHELPVDVAVELRAFADRLELARHLNERLKPLGREITDGDPGLWAWLALVWFDQLCRSGADGARRPGQDYRYVFAFRWRYRHLLYGPYQIYRRHGELVRLLLAGPPHSESSVYHDIVSRHDLIANKGVLEAASMLYLDPRRGRPKPGAQRSVQHSGSLRRFVRILQQLDLTYDIYGLSGEQVLGLLPAEFDGWRRERELG